MGGVWSDDKFWGPLINLTFHFDFPTKLSHELYIDRGPTPLLSVYQVIFQWSWKISILQVSVSNPSPLSSTTAVFYFSEFGVEIFIFGGYPGHWIIEWELLMKFKNSFQVLD